jgi:hypothetical protein
VLFNRVNWEDPHYNVDLPVFTIHGNHDDPVREAAGSSEEVRASACTSCLAGGWPAGWLSGRSDGG